MGLPSAIGVLDKIGIYQGRRTNQGSDKPVGTRIFEKATERGLLISGMMTTFTI